MAKKGEKKPVDYLALKKALNRYHKFSFDAPRKGKTFTSQQKSAITRQYKKLEHLISKKGGVNKNVSYIPYPKDSKLPRVDAIRTNKGIFYKMPGAKLIKQKNGSYIIRTKFMNRREMFFPFPLSVIGSMVRIRDFVDALIAKYKPDGVRWSTKNRRESQRYDPELFDRYISIWTKDADIEGERDATAKYTRSKKFKQLNENEQRDIWRRLKYLNKKLEDETFYNGVFLYWQIETY